MYFRKTYALYSEDGIIAGISERYSIPIVHYIDIGANRPIAGNSTYLFYEKGASGCLIEPIEELINELNEKRANDIIYNVGILGDDYNNVMMPFYYISSVDTRSTFCDDIKDYYTDKGMSYECRQIKLRSLNSIMDECKMQIDYISIDVEGSEYDVIKDFCFERYDVKFFNIEKGNDRVKTHMINSGYSMVSETLSNWIFVKKSLIKDDNCI